MAPETVRKVCSGTEYTAKCLSLSTSCGFYIIVSENIKVWVDNKESCELVNFAGGSRIVLKLNFSPSLRVLEHANNNYSFYRVHSKCLWHAILSNCLQHGLHATYKSGWHAITAIHHHQGPRNVIKRILHRNGKLHKGRQFWSFLICKLMVTNRSVISRQIDYSILLNSTKSNDNNNCI